MITSVTPALGPAATVVAAPYAPAGQVISGTSIDSIAIPLGPPPISLYDWEIVEANIGFRIGMRVRASASDATAGTTTWIEGVVTAWDETTLTIQPDLWSGFGTHNAWNINVTGQPGLTGPKGDPGATGAQGPAYGTAGTGQTIDSPVFSGQPTSTFTPSPGTTHANDATLATTQFVSTSVSFALNNTQLLGNPTAPTPAAGDNDTSIATTQFVARDFAPLFNPTFLGDPKAPTPAAGDNDTSIATTAFVTASFAPIASPLFTGIPKAPTPTAGDNTTALATTAFVHAAVAPLAPIASPAFSGTATAITPTAGDNSTALATTAFVYNATLSLAPLISPSFTGTPKAPTPPIASTDGSLATTQFVKTAILPLATLSSPYFIGSPTAPTQPATTSDGTLATTQFVHNGFQPLNADLSALSGVTGAGVMYYRSSAGAWSPVEMGANMTFSGGTLSSAGGGGGSGTIAEAPNDGTYYARRNLTWAANAIQVDAPSDGNPYIRINGTWTIASAAGVAPINSPAFTGSPSAPTVTPNTDSSTKLATTAFVQSALGSYALTASPTFSGTPTAPTAAAISNDTTISTTAFVKTAISTLASIANPTFTGDPKAPTPTAGDNDTSIATTAFVTNAISGKADASAVAATYAPLAAPVFTGDARAVTPTVGDNDTSIATTAFVTTAAANAVAPLAPLNAPVFTGNPTRATAPAGASNDASLATTAFVQTAIGTAVGSVGGESGGGRLAYASATTLKFTPYRNDKIKINGAIYTIPTTGIAGLNNTGAFIDGVGGQALAASTVYYVYAFNNAGTITGSFSTTGHSTSATAGNVGVEIKNADDTRTLIGMCRTNASSQFVDTNRNRYVISWFNRRTIVAQGTLTANASTVSTTFVDIGDADMQLGFLSWADEGVVLQFGGCASNSAGYGFWSRIIVDSTPLDPITQNVPPGASSAVIAAFTSVLGGIVAVAEGAHLASFQSSTPSSSTVTWYADAVNNRSSTLMAEMRG